MNSDFVLELLKTLSFYDLMIMVAWNTKTTIQAINACTHNYKTYAKHCGCTRIIEVA